MLALLKSRNGQIKIPMMKPAFLLMLPIRAQVSRTNIRSLARLLDVSAIHGKGECSILYDSRGSLSVGLQESIIISAEQGEIWVLIGAFAWVGGEFKAREG